MASNEEFRDRLIEALPEHKATIMNRHAVVEKWCKENGKSADVRELSIDDLLAIRALPEWKNAAP